MHWSGRKTLPRLSTTPSSSGQVSAHSQQMVNFMPQPRFAQEATGPSPGLQVFSKSYQHAHAAGHHLRQLPLLNCCPNNDHETRHAAQGCVGAGSG
jgi:hypothetical protein